MLRFFRPEYESLTDEELLQRYRDSGRMPWLSELYGRYASSVYGMCLKYLHNEQAAEDAAMAVFEQLVEKTRQHDIRQFRSWLHTLAKNHCLMQLRRAGQQREQAAAPDFMQSADFMHLPTEGADGDEKQHWLKICLKGLQEAQRACVSAFYLEGYTYKEIAAYRGEPLGKIRSHIQNGRRNLRICIEEKQQLE